MNFRFIDVNDPQYERELMLRWEVLHKPLGQPPGSERFPDEPQCMHLLALEKKKIVGCVVFCPETDNKGHLYQMAVSEEYRGQGFGRKLLAKLEQFLQKKGFLDVYLYTREDSLGFYERVGFRKEGEPVIKDGLTQFLMHKHLHAAVHEL